MQRKNEDHQVFVHSARTPPEKSNWCEKNSTLWLTHLPTNIYCVCLIGATTMRKLIYC